MPENATPGNITVPNELLKADAFVTALGPPKLQKLNWKRKQESRSQEILHDERPREVEFISSAT